MHRAVAIVIAACSGTPSKPPPAQPSSPIAPGAPAAPVDTTVPVATSARAAPDVPTGAAAARDGELAAKFAPFLDAFLNTEAVFTRDGKRLLFVSNRDGLPQLYVATPDGPATRVVTTKERITGVIAAPGGKDVIFLSDTGADDNWSVFRVGIDGTNLIELTPGDKMRRGTVRIPDGRPSLMFFHARKQSEVKSTVYSALSTAPSTPKAIFTYDKPGGLADVSPDGKTAVFVSSTSRSENQLLRIDVESGKATPIYPSSGEVSIFEARIARDNRRVYIATDGGADNCLIVAIDMMTGKEVGRHAFTPGTARVTTLAVSRDTGLVAAVIAIGNHSEVHLLDARTLAERTSITMPLGSGSVPSSCSRCNALEFSDDGKRLVVPWSTPEWPTDLFVIETATGKKVSRAEPRPSLPVLPMETLKIDIPAFDGGRIETNVYVPKGGRGIKHPTLVSLHGGPANTSMTRWSAGIAFLTSLGYSIVEPNVRGSAGYGRAFEQADDGPRRLDAFRDIETASRWAAAQPWADRSRMAIVGQSYGGYSVLIAMTRWPELWRAGVDMVGIANLETFMATTEGTVREIWLRELGDPDKDAVFLRSISPLTDVGKIDDPLFVYAGANDARVPRSESDQIVAALRARKIPVEYMVADNEGHSAARRETLIQLYPRFTRFLEAALR
jgi:dipeptidyl aminopeptidase/acylaminoacyl peptidase